jgi:hypothetical protein
MHLKILKTLFSTDLILKIEVYVTICIGQFQCILKENSDFDWATAYFDKAYMSVSYFDVMDVAESIIKFAGSMALRL